MQRILTSQGNHDINLTNKNEPFAQYTELMQHKNFAKKYG